MPTHTIRPLEELGVDTSDIDPQFQGKSDLEVFFSGHGDIDYICNRCRTPVVDNIEEGQLNEMVFECTGCGGTLYLPES